jgi:long-chain fatty acid transport protein
MEHFIMRRVIATLCVSGIGVMASTQAMASAFQLWEQSGASIGNYHAGYAASAEDASTAFFNPAGIIRFKNQQVVLGAVGITTDFKYKGNIRVNTINGEALSPVTAQGGTFGLVPDLHYVAPITDRIGFGFSVVAPFGLKTNYGISTILRYAATETSVSVIDMTPSLGFLVTDKASLGVGFDVQRMYAQFEQVAAMGDPSTDTKSTNKANDTAYGYHLGALYQFNPNSRIGLSFHSQVVHHLSGSSKFKGPIVSVFFPDGGEAVSSRASTKVTLPAYTAFSVFQRVHPQVALMGTVVYSQWNKFNQVILDGISGVQNFQPSQSIQVVIPEHYRNSWNVSLGGDFNVTEFVTFRAGVGFDQSPVRDKYRNIQLPDKDRYIIALGGHFQASKAVGVDLGWMHVFLDGDAHVNPPSQASGDQVVTTNGHVSGGADVYAAQVTWDIV